MTTTQTTEQNHKVLFSHILHSQGEDDVVLPLPGIIINSEGGAPMTAEELLQEVDMSVDEGDADMQLSNICAKMNQGRKE